MVNKEKTLKRELIRLRRTQNPQQLDFRKMRKVRITKDKLRSLKRKAVAPATIAPVIKDKKAKPKKKPKKKELEPELELIDDEPELKILDELDAIEEELKAEREAAKEKAKAEKKKKKEKKPELEVIEEEPKAKKKPKKKKEKEPELEVIEDKPESEEISKDLEDLYSYDEDIDEEDVK
ncbi:MAG: hypothetical protein ACW96M_04360 [Candidatus Thorarchaeota archaeon]|jgi:hypothetical protein